MSDDKSGQCAHGYYGLCPHCYDSLRAELDRLRVRLSEAVSTKCDAWWARDSETGLQRAFRADESIPADAVPWWNVGGINGNAPQDDARDAERYRYIRDNAKDGAVKTLLPLYRAHYFVSLEPISECPTFDAAIDAAILAAKVKP